MKIGRDLLFAVILVETRVELFMPISRYTYKNATYIDKVDCALRHRPSRFWDIFPCNAKPWPDPLKVQTNTTWTTKPSGFH